MIPEAEFWQVSETEHINLARRAAHAYMTTFEPNPNAVAWDSFSEKEQAAWLNVVAVVLFTLDGNGKTKETVVIDY